MNELTAFADQNHLNLYEALKVMPIKPPYLKKNVREFIRLMEPLINMENRPEPSELIHLLREGLDYDRFIADDDVPGPDDSKIANINQLQLAANRYRDIASFIRYTESFKDEMSNDKNGVSLMTIHKSKGLEFPVVFVTGFMEGILPNKNGDIEEERRIAFTGLSRAMKRLCLTYSHTYMGKHIKRSAFLDEAL
jgi:DNA helicase-2/ATP-dependent DNA helicase PcrA